MSAPRTPPAPATGRRGGRRRGRWWRRLWLPGALAALLVGVGSQWIGGGSGAPDEGDGKPVRQDPVARSTPSAAGGPTEPAGRESGRREAGGRDSGGLGAAVGSRGDATASAVGSGATTVPSAPTVEPAAGSSIPGRSVAAEPTASAEDPPPAAGGVEPAANATPEPGSESPSKLTTFEPDRFESLLSLVRSRAAQGEFAAARRHLAALQREPLVAPQAAAVSAVAAELRSAVDERVNAILRTAADGAVVRAGRRAAAGLADGSEEFAQRLRAAFTAADLGRDATATPAVPATSWPTPAPIPSDRRLRAYRGAEELLGTAVECDDRRVTLRVAAAGRVRFPTVERIASEPVGATRDEAVEFALAALHAGEPLLARLWLHRAQTAGGTAAASAREKRLVALLR